MLQTLQTGTVTIRQAMPSDMEALVALLHDSFRTTWEPVVTPAAAKAYWESDRARRYVAEMGGEFRVAVSGDAVAGMVHWRGDFVHALHVLSSWRRRGVAMGLMDEAEARIAEAGHPAVRLETDTFNHASQAFYRSRGYQEAKRYPDSKWASGLTTLLLRKPLRLFWLLVREVAEAGPRVRISTTEMTMSTFVLVHGAWHGAWCWERVVPLLESHGHRVITPDLPGIGQDRTPLADVTLEGWARFVADIIRRQEKPVILVGHSRGGIVVSQAAEFVPDRIRTVVYLAAFLVPSGRTLLDTMRRIPPRPESKDSLVFAADQLTSTIAPDAVRRVFYNTTPDEWVARAASLSGPEPMMSFTTPLQVTNERYGSVDRVYIECMQDRAIAPQLQRMMVAEMPCREVITMDTDHSPFYSTPDLLAAHLGAIAANRRQVSHVSSAGDGELPHVGGR